jgi:hypothetical protein
LILEINDGKTVILCEKLNPKEKWCRGESDFSKEYDETVIKKMQEMREMNQGRGRKLEWVIKSSPVFEII